MYYKIISTDSFFALLCKEYGIDIFNIPYGTEFIAPEHPEQLPEFPYMLLGNKYLHFSEGALDTMLWHISFSKFKYAIYKIKPLDALKKLRCKDDLGIYQCGTKRLKILEMQDLDQMYDQAVLESYQFHERYSNFDIDVDRWKKHQPTTTFLRHRYYIPR